MPGCRWVFPQAWCAMRGHGSIFLSPGGSGEGVYLTDADVNERRLGRRNDGGRSDGGRESQYRLGGKDRPNPRPPKSRSKGQRELLLLLLCRVPLS